jgi:hypothetical protein
MSCLLIRRSQVKLVSRRLRILRIRADHSSEEGSADGSEKPLRFILVDAITVATAIVADRPQCTLRILIAPTPRAVLYRKHGRNVAKTWSQLKHGFESRWGHHRFGCRSCFSSPSRMARSKEHGARYS